MNTQSELSRVLSAATSGPQAIEAKERERAALAERFGLIEIGALSATADLARDDDAVIATGHVAATVTQSCVISGEAIPAQVSEDFVLRFLPESKAPTAEETELEEDDCETIYYEGDSFDLGEAIAQTVMLALDPFPRSPDAAKAARNAGIVQEEDVKKANPFAALDGLQTDPEK